MDTSMACAMTPIDPSDRTFLRRRDRLHGKTIPLKARKGAKEAKERMVARNGAKVDMARDALGYLRDCKGLRRTKQEREFVSTSIWELATTRTVLKASITVASVLENTPSKTAPRRADQKLLTQI
jgi:hypothetical protein